MVDLKVGLKAIMQFVMHTLMAQEFLQQFKRQNYHPSHSRLGGERCTNNTAEATALLRIIQWGTDNHRLLGTLVIHYDSEYATNVAVGCSRGYLKIGL